MRGLYVNYLPFCLSKGPAPFGNRIYGRNERFAKTGIFTSDSKQRFEQAMFSLYPNYGCQFMVGLSADTVAQELIIN